MGKRNLIVAACVCAAVLGPVEAGAQWFSFRHPLLGTQAVDFTLRDLAGKEQRFSRLRQGNAAVLFFWATWCPHCVKQLKDLKDSAADFERNGIQLVLVDLGEESSRIRSFLSRLGLSFDVLIDTHGEVSGAYRVQGVPTYIFIDRGGVIRAVEHVLPDHYEEILSGG